MASVFAIAAINFSGNDSRNSNPYEGVNNHEKIPVVFKQLSGG